jgi:hypothetical protein
MPAAAPVPTPHRNEAWRTACIAYRAQRQAGADGLAAHQAAIAALQAVWPLPIADADREVTDAIAYANSHHRAWFWSGLGSDRG